jgi:large subunit ribosomal protein L25
VSGDRFRLEVKQRERLGGPESRRLRKQGFIPGVLYGKTEARAIAISERDLRSALTTSSGLHAVLDVVLEGQTTAHPSILKEYQRDPIRGHVRHVDLQEVRLDVAIHATVQVHLIGGEDAPGVREGGVLSAPTTALNVEALPMEVPASVDFDVSEIHLGESAHLSQVALPDGVKLLDDGDTVFVTVAQPTREVEPEPEEGAEGAEGEAAEGAEPAAEGESGAAESEGDSSDSEE